MIHVRMTFDIRIIRNLEQKMSVGDMNDQRADTNFKSVPLGIVEWHSGGWR